MPGDPATLNHYLDTANIKKRNNCCIVLTQNEPDIMRPVLHSTQSCRLGTDLFSLGFFLLHSYSSALLLCCHHTESPLPHLEHTTVCIKARHTAPERELRAVHVNPAVKERKQHILTAASRFQFTTRNHLAAVTSALLRNLPITFYLYFDVWNGQKCERACVCVCVHCSVDVRGISRLGHSRCVFMPLVLPKRLCCHRLSAQQGKSSLHLMLRRLTCSSTCGWILCNTCTHLYTEF